MRMMMGDQAKLYWLCCVLWEEKRDTFFFHKLTHKDILTCSAQWASERHNMQLGIYHFLFFYWNITHQFGCLLKCNQVAWWFSQDEENDDDDDHSWSWWLYLNVCIFQTCLFPKKRVKCPLITITHDVYPYINFSVESCKKSYNSSNGHICILFLSSVVAPYE